MSTREVELTGGAPWGFRMHGGVDQNQPLRISRVNPGRKASLSGIREGDVITSINGRATKDMSNADAHAMLRSAGPALRLGLNEDREMSPRRRSIGKAAELKRPSQLISEINNGRATPQAPVYATIKPQQLSLNKLLQSPNKSLHSPQSSFNSVPLVKSVASSEEVPKFHPTNPFYSTLPSNYSTSKLPIPNGKVSNSPVHSRSVNRSDTYSDNNNDHDLKLSSFFSRKFDSGTNSIPNMFDDSQTKNSHISPKYSSNDKYNTISNSQSKSSGFRIIDDITNNDRNPFQSCRNTDFHQFEQSNDNLNSTSAMGGKSLFYSKSDGDFQSNEKITKNSTITEKKICEVEEIKTTKKIILNGSNENNHNHKNGILKSSDELSRYKHKQNRSLSHDCVIKENLTPTTIENDEFYRNKIELGRSKQEYHRSSSAREEYNQAKCNRST
ncbi:PDZ and LIM domain protein 3-like [Pararge aegeria]|uniref:PDZ and LIM domain protein 3-like n=1 Tax=Pararge aegeria TaxID=116150 RepID=UPI0019CFC3E3|nr:PDZ and LIM domain protein 3-like [Pararge aegeria]